MVCIEIRSLKRIIEYDLGFLKIENCAFCNNVNTYIKRKNQEDFSYIKSIPNGRNEIMTIETLMQDILTQYVLGNKVKESIHLSLAGINYDYFTFSMIGNGSVINVTYAIGNNVCYKNCLYYANYYDLNQLLYISNNLLSNYLKQQETLKKQKEELIEKYSKKKKSKIPA